MSLAFGSVASECPASRPRNASLLYAGWLLYDYSCSCRVSKLFTKTLSSPFSSTAILPPKASNSAGSVSLFNLVHCTKRPLLVRSRAPLSVRYGSKADIRSPTASADAGAGAGAGAGASAGGVRAEPRPWPQGAIANWARTLLCRQSRRPHRFLLRRCDAVPPLALCPVESRIRG